MKWHLIYIAYHAVMLYEHYLKSKIKLIYIFLLYFFIEVKYCDHIKMQTEFRVGEEYIST